ncbi:DUF2637 domain-containing protein [Streptomyces jeddahensis]|uniref:DUF2637 domain-containing protein n=1 Tax=Streptomyces jeddahensis TaxID=1716141 RepID=A0A177HEZ0_9ACTN|nr:DUF2637 domain-containing protein [Streptomyces jeddahensis]OAH09316.1 hypothetical protein STSP_74000 [Streptomyces jeddahensis]
MAAPIQLTRTHRILIAVVVTGAVIIAGIGFAGSYAAVRELAMQKGFGKFSYVFPIGIDAGICVLLALDLLLTWIRIPFPMLRQTAWLLTAATIAFNGAAAWPDPLGVGMHGVIPILFVVAVEAARHAIGRIADITADKHMEGVRLTRWLLSPIPTFLLWRRMKLWELRSYEQVIKLEQERLVYQARLRSRYGRAWRRKAPVESLMPLRLARYGIPLAETAPAGLAAAGIEPALIPPPPQPELPAVAVGNRAAGAARVGTAAPDDVGLPVEHPGTHGAEHFDQGAPQEASSPWFEPPLHPAAYQGGYDPTYDPSYDVPEEQYEDWYEDQQQPAAEALPQESGIRIPAGPNRTRPLGGAAPGPVGGHEVAIPSPRAEQQPLAAEDASADPDTEADADADAAAQGPALPDDVSREEAYFAAFRKYVNEHMDFPNARQFGLYLMDLYGVTGQSGGPLTESTLRPYVRDFRTRYQQELDAEHIA